MRYNAKSKTNEFTKEELKLLNKSKLARRFNHDP